MENNESEKFIDMNELSLILKAKNKRVAQKWCENLKLPLFNVGATKMTYRFLAETELDRRLIQLLKKKNPDNWEELYRLYKDNDHYGYIVVSENKKATINKALKHTKPLSKEAIEFANDL